MSVVLDPQDCANQNWGRKHCSITQLGIQWQGGAVMVEYKKHAITIPTRLCKPELNLLKSGKKTLFNYAIENTMTRRSRHGRIQKAWRHSTIPTRLCKPELNLLKSGKKTLFNYAIGNTMTRGRHGQIQKAWKHGTIQHTKSLKT